MQWFIGFTDGQLSKIQGILKVLARILLGKSCNKKLHNKKLLEVNLGFYFNFIMFFFCDVFRFYGILEILIMGELSFMMIPRCLHEIMIFMTMVDRTISRILLPFTILQPLQFCR